MTTTTTAIRILVVSDFDLRSASRLAESPLLSSTNSTRTIGGSGGAAATAAAAAGRRDHHRGVDLCIAVNATNYKHYSDPGDDELLA
mmetsp:Transcript_23437/g.47931  ORF Transcript_23437/g.47931 Transcript_23437/m.47931 type:complete len:87 (-) Transcript_23437:1575-1835(-)